MKKIFWIAGIVGICVIAALAFGVTRIALAQDETPPVTPESKGWFRGELGGLRDMMGGRGFGFVGSQANLEAAAEALGITVDELQAVLNDGKTLVDLAEEKGFDLQTLRDAVEAAQKAAILAGLEQSVKDGDITQEQADWMREGMENGYGPGFGRGFRGMMGAGSAEEKFGQTAAAAALGMTVDELSNQLWAGETLSSLAEEKGVELTTVQEAMQAARQTEAKAWIEQAVADGTMTQEQADWLLKGIENGYTMNGQGRGPGLGFRGMHRGERGVGGHPCGFGDPDTTQP
jgi:hypothetical protein